jgi:hypothetical protein
MATCGGLFLNFYHSLSIHYLVFRFNNVNFDEAVNVEVKGSLLERQHDEKRVLFFSISCLTHIVLSKKRELHGGTAP